MPPAGNFRVPRRVSGPSAGSVTRQSGRRALPEDCPRRRRGDHFAACQPVTGSPAARDQSRRRGRPVGQPRSRIEAAMAARKPLAQCTHTSPPGTSPARCSSSQNGMWTAPVSGLPATRRGGVRPARRARRSPTSWPVPRSRRSGSRREQGFVQRSIVRRLEERHDQEAATVLGCAPDEPLVYLERLRLADDQPIVLDCSWLPAALARPLLAVDFTRTALYRELHVRCGIRPDSGWERIRPVLPGKEQRELLGIPARTPALAIERLASSDTTPVEWRHGLVRADRFSYVARWSAQDLGGLRASRRGRQEPSAATAPQLRAAGPPARRRQLNPRAVATIRAGPPPASIARSSAAGTFRSSLRTRRISASAPG